VDEDAGEGEGDGIVIKRSCIFLTVMDFFLLFWILNLKSGFRCNPNIKAIHKT
jgi:hypothetical protein